MIYILEGPDGVGKSTLAAAIAEKTKGHVLHCSWNKDWNMEEYFEEVMEVAVELDRYQDVVIDRWAPSEWVYGNVFRGGEQFDVYDFVAQAQRENGANLTWVMCKHPLAVSNHLKHMELREEMFNDMTDVVANFSLFEVDSALPWVEYDYTKKPLKEWIDEHVTRR